MTTRSSRTVTTALAASVRRLAAGAVRTAPQRTSTAANSVRHHHAATPVWRLPIQTVELLGLMPGSGHTLSKTTAQVVEQPVVVGSWVDAGDLVAVLETDQGIRTEIRAPESGGRVQAWHCQVDDHVSIGDALFDLDTAGPAAVEDPDVQAVRNEMQAHGGNITDSFLQKYMEQGDVKRLQYLALLLRDRFTQHRPKALRLLERVLELQKEQSNNSTTTSEDETNATIDIAQTYTDIGMVLQGLGDLDAALVNLQQALTLLETAYDNNHDAAELLGSVLQLGTVKRQANDLAGAVLEFERALRIQKKHLGEQHSSVGASLNNLGALLFQQGKFHEALKCYREALQIHETLQQDVDIAGSHQNIGVALKYTGDFAGAMDHARRALALRQSALGVHHIDTAASHINLAMMLSEMQQVEGALEQFEAALAIQQERLGVNHASTASTLINMGAVHYQNAAFEQALGLYEQGLERLQIAVGKEHPDVAAAHNNLGLTLYQLQRLDDSLRHHRRAHDILTAKRSKDNNDPSLAATLGSIGNVFKQKGQFEEALAHYKRAHQMLETVLGENHPDVASSHNNMGQVMAALQQFDEAMTVYRSAEKIFQDTFGSRHPHTASCRFNMGLVLLNQGKPADALPEFELAQSVWHEAFGEEHPHTKVASDYVQLCSNRSNEK